MGVSWIMASIRNNRPARMSTTGLSFHYRWPALNEWLRETIWVARQSQLLLGAELVTRLG